MAAGVGLHVETIAQFSSCHYYVFHCFISCHVLCWFSCQDE